MKKLNFIVLIAIIFGGFQQINAQSIAKSLGLYVFPNDNQSETTQDADDSACYKWAIKESGYDPLNPPKIEGAVVDTSADGSAIKGSVRGAAGGAAIGAIAGDAGKGAAIGATVGVLRGRRAKVAGDANQQKANDQAAVNKANELEADYKKAFMVCMEAKGYTIK